MQGNPGRVARNGAVVKEVCRLYDDTPTEGVGRLGWPCLHGSAIQLQAKSSAGILLNCVIHYYPKKQPATASSRPSTAQNALEKYKAALNIFKAANAHKRLFDVRSPDPVDVTRLAADLTAALIEVSPGGKYPYSFKAVIIVPAYGSPKLPFWWGSPAWRGAYHGPWKNNFLGLAAADGYVIFDHIHVPMLTNFDLNLPPQPFGIKLHILLPMPVLYGCGSSLPDCQHCLWGC